MTKVEMDDLKKMEGQTELLLTPYQRDRLAELQMKHGAPSERARAEAVKVGDTVRSFDFVGRKDCFMEGVVWKIEGELLHAYTTRQLFNGKDREINNMNSQFRAPLPGVACLDCQEFQRVVVVNTAPAVDGDFPAPRRPETTMKTAMGQQAQAIIDRKHEAGDDAYLRYVVRYSCKRPDTPCGTLEEALACEDGEDYSAWPVVIFSDGAEIQLIGNDGNMSRDQAEHAIKSRGDERGTKWKASWNYDEKRYEIDSVDEDGGLGGPKQISSEDGNNWTDERGNPVDTEAFHFCEIIFMDGPRKNECVG